MTPHKCAIKVRYAETDQMGVVHHSVYALYYEQARVQLLEDYDINMAKMELDTNLVLPVKSLQIDYITPAYFGETLTVHTKLKHLSKVKLVLDCELYNSQQQLINTAQVKLGITDKDSGKIRRIPDDYYTKLEGIPS